MKKVYTKRGDQGVTTDYSGRKLPKDDALIISVGKIDSLQSSMDLAVLKSMGSTRETIMWIQKKLWQTAGELACADKSCVIDPITEEDLKKLEAFTDSIGEPPSKFVRFNTEESIMYNECRIRCRDLETSLVKLLREEKVTPIAFQFINRLSSMFFMLAYKAGIHE
ncbi:MAG TPA: ATP:cob(I)alamin adenosyltransferase [Candidatus Nanoarchaeia archaeon]|nr:ATP:cob(I)alamin adenosyltransferase [Candidatus Nanoarchaeia archaeon]